MIYKKYEEIGYRIKPVAKRLDAEGIEIELNDVDDIIRVSIGETMESKIKRMKESKEPTNEGVPRYFIDEGEEISPLLDIRTEKFDVLMDLAQRKAELILERKKKAEKSAS